MDATPVRRLETKRGDPAQTIDRSVGVQWDTGEGCVPGGRTTVVVVVVALVALAILYALGRDWDAFRRAAAARRADPPDPPEPPVA